MMRLSAFYLALLALILNPVSPLRAETSDTGADCFERPSALAWLHNHGDPVAVPGLLPRVRIPVEGFLELVPAPGREDGERALSPTGDFTFAVGPYDPVSRRLYLWAYFKVGWIEVYQSSGTWVFGEGGTLRPRLYDSSQDGKGDSVRHVRRSEALGLQFYGGWTAEHWLTGWRSYRFYQIRGAGMTRVPEIEARGLRYLGDDPVAGMAVLVPTEGAWADRVGNLVWYDGSRVIEPGAEDSIPGRHCD
ncbi:hypothetical protein [Roseovarius indicus]|uniref:Uncharacterized protein n=1 Tax=Roseovarius indicus TaxID=540747 RepID=A0A0T5P5A7_9RHOB|nr:hypothetical protein [Roseovarius indicus]KRS16450.1 hypothetical protein XM52_17780 [Roseovarius indicus]QEW28084.1 hypothetical protein RIdsm_03909 [Roseovarius indicus]SFE53739.1 hypothetical protein SAMN04488031_11211 [Roseovarius indicus]